MEVGLPDNWILPKKHFSGNRVNQAGASTASSSSSTRCPL
jgi:hypothetical protein